MKPVAVASHLGIRLVDYDAKIRTFIPDYDELLDAAVSALHALNTATPHIVDCGTGTGALSARCLRAFREARVTAIDEDAEILELARQRLQSDAQRASTLLGSFLDIPIPGCHAIIGSLSFHHVRTADRKREAYRTFRASLPQGGLLVSADCCPSSDKRLAELERGTWRQHMRQTYSDSEIDGHFAAWADEDVVLSAHD